MDLLLNFVVLILVSLLIIHWWIFVVLCFVVMRLTGNLKVHPENGISFSNSASVFGATLIAVFLYQRFVVEDLFGLQSLIAIFIMVAAVRSVTQAIIREKETDTVFRVVKESGAYIEVATLRDANRVARRESEAGNNVSIDKHVGEITSGERITGTVPIVAPIVGTFYASPDDQSKPYVEIGTKVEVGDTLCIIEAMKIFNHVEAERTGIVRQILKRSGDPVEYGETLFSIEVDLTDEEKKNTKAIEKREELYEEVWRELEQGNKDMGLWARLLAKHDGNEEKTTADYLRTRVERLSSKN